MEPASVESLRVLFQSDDYIVVDKHWDIRIDSKMWYEKNTVQAQLRHHFPQLADPNTYYGFRFCHQLDFSTSGVLCVALNKAAAGQAYHCFKERTVTKAYLALVRGLVEEEIQTLDFSIGKNTSEGKTHMMCIEGTDGCENAKPCQTALTVLEYGLYDGDRVTKVLLQPLTGRTHQLRVHCSAIGHPIVGDFTYSSGADDGPFRMMLHAHLLHIPLDREPMLVCAGDPFLSSVDPKWLPQRSVRPLKATVDALLEHRVHEHRRAKETERDQVRQTEEKRRNKSRKEESEEQRRQCEEWLREWAGDS
ncbi:RNA pseudouridylate synthase domain-containing protein 1 [Phycodurus eques]|uniref:RNA pseudouridylate synthase domain-containing protein 1 n=1 Tax=Phycodurus eques TaxID=693459 RepID=UPI002ACD1FF7|nr:RNA pseudouridylate synthase domain-containing protein 1 [Phycodurus eques]XP_061557255.1 RNA pseudouridylate synthase domain-containing protein 1 [Phycodurus eques]XP_061557257.1 RNA pseudouridylate synthase domain-containing protein 1 [Phycodurus eques]XP_061557258.1 RNA pseudouridylate synthase domain-containing protein 1 [Phycodurus eques]